MKKIPKPIRQKLFGDEILIWDSLFSPKFIESLYKILNNTEYDSLADEKNYRSWECPFETQDFSSHDLFTKFSQAISKEPDYSSLSPTCLNAKAIIMTFGDFVELENSKTSGNELTVLYYANSKWKPEWAAETILFSKEEEVALAIAPKPGRLAAFPSSLKRRFGVPSRVTHHSNLIVQFDVALA